MRSFCIWPSRDSGPTSRQWASILFLLLRTCLLVEAWKRPSAIAHHGICQPIGPMKENFMVVGGLQRKNVQRLGRALTFADCLKLLCGQKRGNYAYLTNGVCYAIYCQEKGKFICRVKRNGKVKSALMRISRGKHNLKNIAKFLTNGSNKAQSSQNQQNESDSGVWKKFDMFIIKPHLLHSNKQNKLNRTNSKRNNISRPTKSKKALVKDPKLSLQIKFVGADLMQANSFLDRSQKKDSLNTFKKNGRKHLNKRNEYTSLTSGELQTMPKGGKTVLTTRPSERLKNKSAFKRSILTHTVVVVGDKVSSSRTRTVNNSTRFTRNLLVPLTTISSNRIESSRSYHGDVTGSNIHDVRNNGLSNAIAPSLISRDKERKLSLPILPRNSKQTVYSDLKTNVIDRGNILMPTLFTDQKTSTQAGIRKTIGDFPVKDSESPTVSKPLTDVTLFRSAIFHNETILTTKAPSFLTTENTLNPLPQPPLNVETHAPLSESATTRTPDLLKGMSSSARVKELPNGESGVKLSNIEIDLNNQMELHSTPLIEIRGKITSNGTILADATTMKMQRKRVPIVTDEGINIPAQNAISGVEDSGLQSIAETREDQGEIYSLKRSEESLGSSPVDLPFPVRLKIPPPSENVPFIDQGLSKVSSFSPLHFKDDKDHAINLELLRSAQKTNENSTPSFNGPFTSPTVVNISTVSEGLPLYYELKSQYAPATYNNARRNTKYPNATVDIKINDKKRTQTKHVNKSDKVKTRKRHSNVKKRRKRHHSRRHSTRHFRSSAPRPTGKRFRRQLRSTESSIRIPLIQRNLLQGTETASVSTVRRKLPGIKALKPYPLLIDFYRPAKKPKQHVYKNILKKKRITTPLTLAPFEYHRQGCNSPMGISNGIIPNSQMTASSQLSKDYAASRGRIKMSSDDDAYSAWCANPDSLSKPQYLQIDLGQNLMICKVATQGDRRTPNWVKTYMLSYSMDGKRWKTYTENGHKKIFLGNKGQDDTTSKELTHPIWARFIRFLPQRWKGNTICMGVELFNRTKSVSGSISERSTIPKTYGLLDYLTFEKQDDNIVLDSSPFGNNGFLNRGATIYDTHSSCRHAVRIQKGSDILLDGRNMRVKPRTAISISVWARLDRTEGVHSLFDTIGSHSLHKQGQFHFEVIGGAVRWFHRNETANEIFSVITEPRVIPANVWSHLVATYDAISGKAQIYVNGSLFASARGNGMLSQDWDGRIGLGRHKDVRDLEGDMDEFMLFNKVLKPAKIMELSRKCYFGKYFCGATLVAESGLLVSPEYPAFHIGQVECIWDVEAEPDELVILEIQEFNAAKDRDCSTNSFEVRDGEGDTKIGEYCGVNPPPRIESHGNHMWVRYSTNKKNILERFKIEYRREKKRSLKKTMTKECHGSDVMENVTLVGGPKAGNFTDLGPVDNMLTCIGKCCKKDECDVGFMIDGNCYGVRCANEDLCKIRKARPSNLHPMISFMSRGGIPARVRPQFVNDKATAITLTENGAGAGESGDSCPHTDVHKNVTLVGGLKAGNFSSYGRVSNFSDCIARCCKKDSCDAAFMVKDTCFGVQCASDRLCAFKKAKNSPYSPTLSYILKQKTEKQVQAPGTTKSVVDRRAKACGTMRISKVYRDVTLTGGINAGDFTDRGQVANMDDCIAHCCSDDACNLAFVIKNTCFTVKCKEYSTCGLKTAASEFYNPRIAYVNWSPPRDNLGEGILHYSYKGCWRDFDMSAFAIPLLEGTDTRLNSQYKKREDPVNDCSTVAQSHGYTVFAIQNGGACFSGRDAEQTFRRYGRSDSCKGGRGGPFANSVYRLFDDGSIMSLGCWADLQDRAFRRLEKIDALLEDDYQKRADAVGICAKVAEKYKLRTFALQKGGQCFLAKDDNGDYVKYGPSRKCRYGLGGQMANDVYVLAVSNKTKIEYEESIANDTIMNNKTIPVSNTTALIRNLTLDTTTVNAVHPGDVVYKEELTDSDEIKYIYTAGETLNNVTLASGINAGTFLDKGKLSTMEECIKACGETPQCDVAFMLGKQCFSVDCYGDSVCNTKQAFSSFYNPKVAYVTHKIVKNKRKKEASASSLVIRNQCKNYKLYENVTLVEGINSGNFSDLGHVSSMNDCINRCCNDNSCQIAFRIEDDCYGVKCFSKEKCKTRPARNSGVFHPFIAFIRDIVDAKEPSQESKSKQIRPMDSAASKSNCSSDIWDGEVKINQTLVGGINAGEFTDHGQTETIGDCMSYCCSEKTCDLAFMIDKDCYTVQCKSPGLCRTRPARPTKFHPMIAFKKPTEVVINKYNLSEEMQALEEQIGQAEQASSSSSSISPSSPSAQPNPPIGSSPVHPQKETSPNGVTELYIDLQDAATDQIIFCNKTKVEVKVKMAPTTAKPLLRLFSSSTTARIETVTPIRTQKTVIPHQPDGEVAPVLLPQDVQIDGKPLHGGHSKQDYTGKQTCDASSVIHNATLKMGMHSGVFTKLGRVKDMSECIKRCCRSANADVAYVLGSMCFAVKCFSQELCKTVPVMMSLIGNLNINPSLSFLTKKEKPVNDISSSVSADLESIYTALTDLSDEEDNLLFNNNMSTTYYNNMTEPGYKKSNMTHLLGSRGRAKSGLSVTRGEDLEGLRYASSAKDVTTLTDLQSQGLLSQVNGDGTPLIIYSTNDKPMMYLDEASPESNYQMCLDSPVTYNVTLRGGISAGNFTEQGEGLTTRECIGKCCDTPQCDLAFMFGDRCYSVACANEGLCQAVLAKPSGLEPKVAYVTKNRNLDYNNEGITFEVNSNENAVCKASDLEHGPVYINKSLVGEMDAGNYTYLGKASNMADCIARSCRADHHDMAYMIDDDCFSVHCFSPDLCKLTNKQPLNGNVQISEIFKTVKKTNSREKSLSYVIIGISGFGIVLAALFLASCYFFRRRKQTPASDDPESVPNKDR